MFATFSESVTKALNAVRSQPPQAAVKELYENKHVLMRPNLRLALTTCNINQLQLLSATGLEETRCKGS